MPTYVFNGVVLPERAHIDLPTAIHLDLHHPEADLKGKLSISIRRNQISVLFLTDRQAQNLYTMRNIITDNVSIITDCLSVATACAYDIELISVLDVESKEHTVFHTDMPPLPNIRPGEPVEFDIWPLFCAAADNIYIRRAAADVCEAIKKPHDTGFLCYRSAESILQYIKQTIETTDKKKAISVLVRDLNVAESDLDFLCNLAKDVRHGKPAWITGDDRGRAIDLARNIIQRAAAKYATTAT